jgi:hypothetical protein
MSLASKFVVVVHSVVLAAGLAVLTPGAARAQSPAAQRNQQLLESRKRVTEAQAIVTDLKAEQKRIKDKKQAEFESKEEWKNTVADHKKAKAAYDAALKAAKAAVLNKPEYKALLKEKETLQAKMEALSGKAGADPDAISKTGSQLSVKALALKRMETEALEQDPKTLDAKDALDVAEKNMKALEEEVEATLATDPDYAALLTQIEQAETQVAAAKEADVAARKAARPAPAPRPAKAPRASKRGADY